MLKRAPDPKTPSDDKVARVFIQKSISLRNKLSDALDNCISPEAHVIIPRIQSAINSISDTIIILSNKERQLTDVKRFHLSAVIPHPIDNNEIILSLRLVQNGSHVAKKFPVGFFLTVVPPIGDPIYSDIFTLPNSILTFNCNVPLGQSKSPEHITFLRDSLITVQICQHVSLLDEAKEITHSIAIFQLSSFQDSTHCKSTLSFIYPNKTRSPFDFSLEADLSHPLIPLVDIEIDETFDVFRIIDPNGYPIDE